MANYKTEATAADLADELARRTGLPAAWGYVSGVPTVRLGEVTLKTAGGIAIQVQDRRNEGDAGWDALPGFSNVSQNVYNTGTLKIVSEGLVDVSVTPAYATGTYTATGVNVDTQTVTINGVVLTSKTVPVTTSDYAIGADSVAAAQALKNCINNHPQLKNLVLASGVAAIITLTAKMPGAAGNAITTTETQTNGSFAAGVLGGGAGTSQGAVTPLGIEMKVWAACAKRGMKVEVWETAVGTPPMSDFSTMATSYLQGEFYPNDFWPIQGQA
jgi:hypothetical protein